MIQTPGADRPVCTTRAANPSQPANQHTSESEHTSMTNPFAAPSKGDSLPLDELKGALLIVLPTEQIEGINTTFGVANAVKATVHVVDGKLAGEVYVDTLLFPKILQSAVRREIGTGKPVLGRLGKGQAKPKQSPPWILEVPTAADIEAAMPVWNGLQDDHPF